VNPGFPPISELKPDMDRHAEELLKAKKIEARPDIDKIMLRQFMEQAEA
jgi:hypothetical protein